MAAMRLVGPYAFSLRFDARLSNDLRPFRGFGPEVCGTLFGRAANWIEAERRHPFLHVRQRDNLDDPPWSSAMISLGVRAGTITASHASPSMSGYPASAIVGTSGNACDRILLGPRLLRPPPSLHC